jgi:hypothetical protein
MHPARPRRPPVPLHPAVSLTRHQDRQILVYYLRDLVVDQPARRRGPENPKPGRESTTTLRASEDAVPCANGSVSSGSSFQYPTPARKSALGL